MGSELPPTKILIVDNDVASFEIRQCIAQTLAQVPRLELFHARDATEALSMLERLDPDVIVLDDNEPGECDLFMDSLGGNHPPILVCTEDCKSSASADQPAQVALNKEVTYMQKNESLEGFHQTLMLAATIGMRSHSSRSGKVVH